MSTPRSRAANPRSPSRSRGVAAGNTALCSVGQQRQRPALSRLRHPRSGRDLRVRRDRLSADPRQAPERARARRLQDQAQEPARHPGARARHPRAAAAAPHPMDVMRTGRVGARLRAAREPTTTMPRARAKSPITWWRASGRCSATGITSRTAASRIHVETDDDSVGGHFLHLLHRRPPPRSWVRAMHTSLILYAEHEFNSSTFTARVIAGTGLGHLFLHHRRHRRAARTRNTAAPTKSRWKSRNATTRPMRPRPTSASASPTRKS